MLASLSKGTNASLYSTTCCKKGSNSSDRMIAVELNPASVLHNPVSVERPAFGQKISLPNSISSNQAHSTPGTSASIVEKLQV